jgi:vWA-MoxR associated protein C-terminal domain/Effector-associated domain 1
VVDWNDNEKRKAFRKALQAAYPSGAALGIFVDEELNENLATVAGGENLEVTAHGLVQWAKAKGRIDEVYSAFKRENPSHAGIKIIERQSFIPQSFNLTSDDWDVLFGYFLSDDLADLQRAFRQGFKDAIGVAFQARRTDPPVAEVLQIRELLEEYDVSDLGPILAVRFVERAIAQFHRSIEVQNRDLSVMEAWRDRIAAKFQVPPVASTPSQRVNCHAYLLVALEVSGSDVNVYPELHITGAKNPIGFDAKPTTCPINQVADWISEWIVLAEDSLETNICDDVEVTLEVFLPCQYLEEDIAIAWSVKDKRGDSIALGIHRRFVVRSSDRIRDPQIQKTLQGRWIELQSSLRENKACKKFYLQTDYPKAKGMLCAALKDNGALGLKFLAPLPIDASERIDLYNGIIDAGIPIALWSSEMADLDALSLKAEFDTLLQDCHFTNFTELARRWRMQRSASPYIKLLCDRPDRLPRLPDIENRPDTDAIVSF